MCIRDRLITGMKEKFKVLGENEKRILIKMQRIIGNTLKKATSRTDLTPSEKLGAILQKERAEIIPQEFGEEYSTTYMESIHNIIQENVQHILRIFMAAPIERLIFDILYSFFDSKTDGQLSERMKGDYRYILARHLGIMQNFDWKDKDYSVARFMTW